MSNEQLYALEEALASASSVSSFSSLVSLAAYVFSALALYTIAQRREIKHAWMAWIPLLNMWILGSISDQYRLAAKGEKKSKRKVLLTVNILNFILIWVAVIKLVITVVMAASYTLDESELIGEVLSGLVFFIPVMILGLVGLIVEIMALYDVYSSCDPANNVLYLVLSIIPGISQIARPLFLFLCREKDNGMPPKRENVVVNPVEF